MNNDIKQVRILFLILLYSYFGRKWRCSKRRTRINGSSDIAASIEVTKKEGVVSKQLLRLLRETPLFFDGHCQKRSVRKALMDNIGLTQSMKKK